MRVPTYAESAKLNSVQVLCHAGVQAKHGSHNPLNSLPSVETGQHNRRVHSHSIVPNDGRVCDEP